MKIYKIMVCLSLLIVSIGTFAQGSQMFIEQIQGKTISLNNFNSTGRLGSRQEYVAGKINQSGNTLRISIQAKFYDETNKLTSSYTTTYRCEHEEI